MPHGYRGIERLGRYSYGPGSGVGSIGGAAGPFDPMAARGRSLDERSVDLVLDLFARLRAERPGMTMIIVTHDARVAGTADRIIWLRDGRVDYAHRAAGSA